MQPPGQQEQAAGKGQQGQGGAEAPLQLFRCLVLGSRVIDEKGQWVNPNEILAILLKANNWEFSLTKALITRIPVKFSCVKS